MSYLQTNTTVIKNKVGLLNLAQELDNISKACKVMGFSRDTFYRYQEAVEAGGVDQLVNKSKRGPNVKNRIDPTIEKAVKALAIDKPAWGQTRASNELRRQGLSISPAGVRCVWIRHDLENINKRLKALEAKVALEGEDQLVIFERRKAENEAHGEIETEHPGYLGSQDTFYVGTIKGVGRIYQQTFVDTYSKMAFCKLYNMKTPITAADLLNDKVLPFFESQEVPMLRMLTDRGTEFCGKVNNMIISGEINEIQFDLDEWIQEYNFNRTHQGKMCNGRTPWETFLAGKEIVKKKILSGNITREVKDERIIH